MGSSNGEIAERLFTVLGGLLLTYVVGLIYLNARFGSGLAPAPFLTTMFLLGLAAGFVCTSLLPPLFAYRLVLLVGAIAVLGVAASSHHQFFFWFAAVPSVGALAATLPLLEARRVVGAWRAMPLRCCASAVTRDYSCSVRADLRVRFVRYRMNGRLGTRRATSLKPAASNTDATPWNGSPLPSTG